MLMNPDPNLSSFKIDLLMAHDVAHDEAPDTGPRRPLTIWCTRRAKGSGCTSPTPGAWPAQATSLEYYHTFDHLAQLRAAKKNHHLKPPAVAPLVFRWLAAIAWHRSKPVTSLHSAANKANPN